MEEKEKQNNKTQHQHLPGRIRVFASCSCYFPISSCVFYIKNLVWSFLLTLAGNSVQTNDYLLSSLTKTMINIEEPSNNILMIFRNFLHEREGSPETGKLLKSVPSNEIKLRNVCEMELNLKVQHARNKIPYTYDTEFWKADNFSPFSSLGKNLKPPQRSPHC